MKSKLLLIIIALLLVIVGYMAYDFNAKRLEAQRQEKLKEEIGQAMRMDTDSFKNVKPMQGIGGRRNNNTSSDNASNP